MLTRFSVASVSKSARACFYLRLAALLLGGCSIPLISTSAWASFSLTYSPNNWTLLNSALVNPISSPPDPPPTCASDAATNCFLEMTAATGNAVLNGPTSLNAATTTTTWRSSAPGTQYQNGYYVSFQLDFFGDSFSSAFYKLDGVTVQAIPDGGTYIRSPFYLANNQIIEFGIVSQSTNLPQLQISNFNATYAAPGPLPAAGAASAFTFSRRLRRRVRGETSSGKRSRTAPHPAAYLNLSATELVALPLSFTYPTTSSAACHGLTDDAATSLVISADGQSAPAAGEVGGESARGVHPSR